MPFTNGTALLRPSRRRRQRIKTQSNRGLHLQLWVVELPGEDHLLILKDSLVLIASRHFLLQHDLPVHWLIYFLLKIWVQQYATTDFLLDWRVIILSQQFLVILSDELHLELFELSSGEHRIDLIINGFLLNGEHFINPLLGRRRASVVGDVRWDDGLAGTYALCYWNDGIFETHAWEVDMHKDCALFDEHQHAFNKLLSFLFLGYIEHIITEIQILQPCVDFDVLSNFGQLWSTKPTVAQVKSLYQIMVLKHFSERLEHLCAAQVDIWNA